MPTLQQIIENAQGDLTVGGVANPSLDARLLIAHALGCDRAALLSRANEELGPSDIQKIDTLIERRARREPVARIIGEREFWGLPFGLNKSTLEPRADSETLVEVTKQMVARGSIPAPVHTNTSAGMETGATTRSVAVRLLDLGTGTGCLLLALLHEWPQATGVGVDISPRAVEQAEENAERLGLADRATFQTGNWLEGIQEKFDLIISNPPYIADADILNLMPEVRDYDPPAALKGGADGLDIYRQLIPQLPSFLKPNGAAIFEVGQGQAESVAEILSKNGFADIQIRNDLAGIPRAVFGRKSA